MDFTVFDHIANKQDKVLALDLEGTLISNAVSQFPMTNLSDFLEQCKSNFKALVMYTTVPENKFRSIANTLIHEGDAPAWLAELEVVNWDPENESVKDLKNVQPNWVDVVILDDMERYILPDQKGNWVKANPEFSCD
ncbi:MAG: hypothetical protein JXR36_03310 [Bacteroidales bacterium]|nr:hypothetical protein [Bacteroidales bacterium]